MHEWALVLSRAHRSRTSPGHPLCQTDHDYLTDPAGPHLATMDRCQELRTELDTRDGA